jgi:hypothetical protein
MSMDFLMEEIKILQLIDFQEITPLSIPSLSGALGEWVLPSLNEPAREHGGAKGTTSAVP